MLSPKEKGQLKRIRESVPMPDADTIMQKVIPSNDIGKYLDGTYNKVGGYVTRSDDSKHLKTYNDFYNSLRLDYPQSAFNPFSDDSIGVIRYKTDETSKIKIPYSKEMGGIDVGECPFSGNGFTKAANGEIIPEFRSDGYLEISDGSQLSEIKKDGTEFLRGVYDANKGKFVSVE